MLESSKNPAASRVRSRQNFRRTIVDSLVFIISGTSLEVDFAGNPGSDQAISSARSRVIEQIRGSVANL
jgi:hypothetical protein